MRRSTTASQAMPITKQTADPTANQVVSNLDERAPQLDQLQKSMACLQRQDSIVASVMGIDYENWKLIIVHADPPPKTLSETRSELASGRFRYLPIGFGDYQELQLSFLLKCQELHVPAAKVPPFEIKTPRKITNVSLQMPPLLPPPSDLLRDTDESWTKKVQVAWSEYSRTLLPRVHRRVHDLTGKVLYPQPRRRESREQRPRRNVAPINLRLEWAVVNVCMGKSYTYLHRKHNPGQRSSLDAITRATQRVLDQLQLR
jgi:hypothetical protein